MRFLIFLIAVLQVSLLQAQEVRAQVLDAVTKQPIPYANIIFAENRGLVTNEEGFFSYNSEDENFPRLLKSLLWVMN